MFLFLEVIILSSYWTFMHSLFCELRGLNLVHQSTFWSVESVLNYSDLTRTGLTHLTQLYFSAIIFKSKFFSLSRHLTSSPLSRYLKYPPSSRFLISPISSRYLISPPLSRYKIYSPSSRYLLRRHYLNIKYLRYYLDI